MKRRNFLKVAFFGTSVLLAAGATYSLYGNKSTYEKLLHTIITAELSFLPLDEKGIDAFCRDYFLHEQLTYKKKIVLRLLSFSGRTIWFLPQQMNKRLSLSREKIIETYLFSTNFFQKNKVSSSVAYIAYYDPWTYPCANPFAIMR